MKIGMRHPVILAMLVVFCCGLLAGCLGGLGVGEDENEGGTFIQDAVDSGKVLLSNIVVNNRSSEFGSIVFETEVVFSLQATGKTGSYLTVVAPQGMRLTADQDVSDLVIFDSNCQAVLTSTSASGTITCGALSLDYQKTQPWLMQPSTKFSIAGEVGSDLQTLMHLFSSRRVDESAAQLAIWSQYSGDEPEDIISVVELNFSAGQEETAEGFLESSEKINGTIGSNPTRWIGMFTVGLFVFAVLVSGSLFLGEAFSKQHAAQPAVQAEKVGQILPPEPVKPIEIVRRLTGTTGSVKDRSVTLKLPCLVSRGSIEWMVLPDEDILTPYALFDLIEAPFRYKILDPKMGQTRGRKFIDVNPGESVEISPSVSVMPLAGKIVVTRGMQTNSSFGDGWKLVAISHARSNVMVIGEEESSISDAHAYLFLKGQDLWVRDLNSSNGTFVNQNRVPVESPARDGDTLRFGKTEYKLSIE